MFAFAAANKESYVRTYFPSAFDSRSAAAIDLGPGAQLNGIEIRMQKRRTFEILGSVTGPKITGAILVTCQPTGSTEPPATGQTSTNGPALVFQFRDLVPGTYTVSIHDASAVIVDGTRPKRQLLMGSSEVTITDHDVRNLTLPLQPAVEIAGRVSFESEDASMGWDSATRLHVSLFAESLTSMGAPIGEDGTFHFPGAGPFVYVVDVNPLPQDAYVKAIRYSGRNLNDRMLDLRSASSGELAIVLSRNAGGLIGMVRNAEDQPVISARVQVCDGNERIVSQATSDQSGQFQIGNLAPGEYRIYAWEYTGNGIITVPEFRQLFDKFAVKIKVEEKDRQNLALKLVPIAAMDEAATKIP